MKKINDSKLYYYFIIITLVIGILLGLIFSYSAFLVEPEIKQLISSEDNINDNYKKAFMKLKNPQIFARYENYDQAGMRIKTIIRVYDEKIEKNAMFDKNDKRYLELLLKKRDGGFTYQEYNDIFLFAYCSRIDFLCL